MQELRDILVSQDIDNIVVANTIGYGGSQEVEKDGMFLRIDGGITYLYRAPDNDTHWTDEDATDVALGTVENVILSVTPNQDVLTSDGSFFITSKLDNVQNQVQTVIVTVYDDGVSIGTAEVTMQANERGRDFTFSGGLDSSILSGSVVTVGFQALQDDNIFLKGSTKATKIILTKADSTPVLSVDDVVDIMDTEGATLQRIPLAGSTNQITRSEIEAELAGLGYSLPLGRDVLFYGVGATDKTFIITYNKAQDEFSYEKLTKAL